MDIKDIIEFRNTLNEQANKDIAEHKTPAILKARILNNLLATYDLVKEYNEVFGGEKGEEKLDEDIEKDVLTVIEKLSKK